MLYDLILLKSSILSVWLTLLKLSVVVTLFLSSLLSEGPFSALLKAKPFMKINSFIDHYIINGGVFCYSFTFMLIRPIGLYFGLIFF